MAPGDEVIVLKPAYDCYEPAIAVNGGVAVCIQLKAPDYGMDWKELKSKIGPKTRMVIINTPHNPSGTLLSETDMLQLQQCLKNTDVILLSDEVYEHIVFDGRTHESASKFLDLAARTFVCASFGKTFHTTGWKIGYCAAPKALMQEFQKVHQFNVFCANHPLQHAFAHYLRDPSPYLGLSSFYAAKRDLFLSHLKSSRFTFVPAQGTYFQLLGYSNISTSGDVDFAKKLAMEHQVAGIPISVFNVGEEDSHYIRFCFAKTDETLARAAAILSRL